MTATLGPKDVPVTTRKGKQQMYLTFINIDGMEGDSRENQLVMRSFSLDNYDDFLQAMIDDINNGVLIPFRKYQDTPYYYGQNVDLNGKYCQIHFINTKTNKETYEYNC